MAETMPPPLPADAREPIAPSPGDVEAGKHFVGGREAERLQAEATRQFRASRREALETQVRADEEASRTKAKEIVERFKAEAAAKPLEKPGIPERADKWVEEIDTNKGLKKVGKGVLLGGLFIGAAVGTVLRWPVKKAYHAADAAVAWFEGFAYAHLPGPLKKFIKKPRQTAGEEAVEKEKEKETRKEKKRA